MNGNAAATSCGCGINAINNRTDYLLVRSDNLISHKDDDSAKCKPCAANRRGRHLPHSMPANNAARSLAALLCFHCFLPAGTQSINTQQTTNIRQQIQPFVARVAPPAARFAPSAVQFALLLFCPRAFEILSLLSKPSVVHLTQAVRYMYNTLSPVYVRRYRVVAMPP